MGAGPYDVVNYMKGVTTLEEAKDSLGRYTGNQTDNKPRINTVYELLTTGQSGSRSMPAYYGNGDAGYAMRDNDYKYTDDIYMGDADHPMNVKMDNSPVTSRLDTLITLLDTVANPKEVIKAGPSNSKPLGFGKPETKTKVPKEVSSKGSISTGQYDRLASIHSSIARRTRVGVNYNQL
jgi:hypothetical protein